MSNKKATVGSSSGTGSGPMSTSFPGGGEGMIQSAATHSEGTMGVKEVLGAKRHHPVPGGGTNGGRGHLPTGGGSKL